MKSRAARMLAREHLTLETLVLAGFLWLCIAPLIAVIVLPWMGAATAIILAAGALLVACAAAIALTAADPQATPLPVTERRRSRARPRASRERPSPRQVRARLSVAGGNQGYRGLASLRR